VRCAGALPGVCSHSRVALAASRPPLAADNTSGAGGQSPRPPWSTSHADSRAACLFTLEAVVGKRTCGTQHPNAYTLGVGRGRQGALG